MKKFILLSFLTFLLYNNKLVAQDPEFSQFYSAGLYLNPALAALEGDYLFAINYRDQKFNTVFPYKLTQASVIAPLYYKNNYKGNQFGGIGLSFYNDVTGVGGSFKTSGASVAGAYNVFLDYEDRMVVTFGLQGGFVQKRLDLSQLQWGSQYNPNLGFDQTIQPNMDLLDSRLFSTFSSGMMFTFNPKRDKRVANFIGFMGFSAANLNRPNESMVGEEASRRPILYKFHAGGEKLFNRKLSISPNILAMYQKGAMQINLGSYFTYRFGNPLSPSQQQIDAGIWYRWDDSIIALIGMNFSNFSVGISYDLNTTSMKYRTPQGGGTLEVSLGYRILKGGAKRRKTNTPFF